jgi:CheY-like chemotaxis protein
MSDKTNILIVDDDPDYRVSLRAFLEAEGFRVLEAATGHDGLKAALAERPDLIILDIMMESPVEGYTVNQAIKHQAEYAALREIPIVMVSAIHDDPGARFPMAPEAELISPDLYVTKPLDFPRLLTAIRRMTGGGGHEAGRHAS